MLLGREQPLPEDFWSGFGQTEPSPADLEVANANSHPHTPEPVDPAEIPLPQSEPTSPEPNIHDLPTESTPPEGPFERKFINDLPPVGRGPQASVWPIYNEHAEKADKEMIETYNGGMDNLLIFAALFSAVVTAFIVLALPLLQADPSQPIVDALNLISLQLASQGASNISTTMASTESNAASPTFSPVSINALWIMSLFVSLSTSVLAMLVKQWLRGYITNLPLPQKERATTRQARYDGVQSWRVAGIADSLPVLIHLAVALFLAGLVLYLSSLSMDLMWLVSILAVLGALGYLVLAMLPLFWPHRPYRSPVTTVLSPIAILMRAANRFIRSAFSAILRSIGWSKLQNEAAVYDLPQATKDVELEAHTLAWLAQTSSDAGDAKAVVSACVSWQEELVPNPLYKHFKEIMKGVLSDLPHFRALLLAPEDYNPTSLPADQYRVLLTNSVITWSALSLDPEDLVDHSLLDWARLYPYDSLPTEENLTYAAVLLAHLSPASHCFIEPYWTWFYSAERGILTYFSQPQSDISLFACLLFLTYIRRLPDFKQEEWQASMANFIRASLSVPVEILCGSRLLHDPTWQRVSDNRKLSVMDEFFLPMIEEMPHSDLSSAAIQHLTTLFQSNQISSVDAKKYLKSLLSWFRAQGQLYPERALPLPNPIQMERDFPHEIQLLKQFWKTFVIDREDIMLPLQDVIDMLQLCKVRVWRQGQIFEDSSAEPDHLLILVPQLTELLQKGQALKDSRVLLLATHILYRVTREPSAGSSLRMVFRQFQKPWLRWLCEPGMIELHWQGGDVSLGEGLNVILYWEVEYYLEEVHESGVVEAVRTFYMKDPEHAMRIFLALYDEKLKDRAERTASRNERGVWNVEHTAQVQVTSRTSPHRTWFQQMTTRLNPISLFNSLLSGAGCGGAPVEPTEPDVELGFADGGQNQSAGTSRIDCRHKEPTASTGGKTGRELPVSHGVQGAAAVVPFGERWTPMPAATPIKVQSWTAVIMRRNRFG